MYNQIKKQITFTVNKEKVFFDVEVGTSLQEVLRENGFTSVKQGCGVGECGACTTLVDNVPVDACIYLAVWADGKEIRTAEGEVVAGKLSCVQQAYVDEGAVQCGFCTPGFIMTSTAFAEKYKGKGITRGLIRKEHSGNLCRCTGYESITCAVEKACD
jgi:xanthine dehydrogenase iron-sulfur-binding subunit